MFVDFICTVLSTYDRVCTRLGLTGPRRRRRVPLLPALALAAGVAVVLLGVRSHHWLFAVWGALLALLGIAGIDQRLRGPADASYQRTMIAALALLAAGLPHNVPLTEPQTGYRL